jgi:hypothetical protein
MTSLKTLLAATSTAVLLLAPLASAHAQAEAVDANAVITASHGDWTLKEREDWLFNRLDKARDGGAIDPTEVDRVRHDVEAIRDDEHHMRDHHDGQLTDNETVALEDRLNGVADKIHWLHDDAFRRPW